MFEEREDLVLEDTENVGEPTTEEMVEGKPEAAEEGKEEKKYTEAELNERVDDLVAKKLSRKEAKIRREFDKEIAPYKNAERVLNAGLGTTNIIDATAQMAEFYKERGIEVPKSQAAEYNESDLKILAESEVQKIIEAGMDEVIEEVDRLAEKGVDKMSKREKLIFTGLARYRKAEDTKEELKTIGVNEEVVESKEFQAFASKFNENTPIKEVYELYAKTSDKPHIEKMGSMKNGSTEEAKTFYTPEEADKLTEKDLENPVIFKNVRNSMLKW
jgi:hypothetical protein|nr:MAG TPA: hypothetical protein [Caudoviricetes sp.]